MTTNRVTFEDQALKSGIEKENDNNHVNRNHIKKNFTVENKENDITKSETLREKINDERDRGLVILRYLRPFLIKLLLHMILLFLAIRAYLSYRSSTDSYNAFMIALNNNVLIDVKFLDYKTPCPENYSNIIGTGFPNVDNGCRCDWSIFPGEVCQILSQSLIKNINQSYKKNYTEFNPNYKEVKDKIAYCDYIDKQIKRPNTNQNSFLRYLQLWRSRQESNSTIDNDNIDDAYFNKSNKHLSQKYEVNIQGKLNFKFDFQNNLVC